MTHKTVGVHKAQDIAVRHASPGDILHTDPVTAVRLEAAAAAAGVAWSVSLSVCTSSSSSDSDVDVSGRSREYVNALLKSAQQFASRHLLSEIQAAR